MFDKMFVNNFEQIKKELIEEIFCYFVIVLVSVRILRTPPVVEKLKYTQRNNIISQHKIPDPGKYNLLKSIKYTHSLLYFEIHNGIIPT